jgi:hypothetical protein
MKTAIMIVAGWTLLNLVVFAVALLRRDPEIRAKALAGCCQAVNDSDGGPARHRCARADHCHHLAPKRPSGAVNSPSTF